MILDEKRFLTRKLRGFFSVFFFFTVGCLLDGETVVASCASLLLFFFWSVSLMSLVIFPKSLVTSLSEKSRNFVDSSHISLHSFSLLYMKNMLLAKVSNDSSLPPSLTSPVRSSRYVNCDVSTANRLSRYESLSYSSAFSPPLLPRMLSYE